MEYLNTQGHVFKQKSMGGNRPARMIFSDNAIYILDYGIGLLWLTLSVQFGLIGGLISWYFIERRKKNRDLEFSNNSLDQLVDQDKNSYRFAYSAIEKFEQKTGFFTKGTIVIWHDNNEYHLVLPKESQQPAIEALRSRCPGRERQA